jgi:hypothetical protein
LKLRLPLVGDLLIKAAVLRFAQTMGTLLRGGVPILVSLKLVEEHAENRLMAADLAYAYAVAGCVLWPQDRSPLTKRQKSYASWRRTPHPPNTRPC